MTQWWQAFLFDSPLVNAVRTSDVLCRKNLIRTESGFIITSCIVILFNPNELWSIAEHYSGPLTNGDVSACQLATEISWPNKQF